MGSYTTGVLGTAEYMAPEQANAGEVDHRADVYGLGCVVFHALTGQPPYPGDDLITTLMSHVSDPLPLTGNPGWDGFFATVLAKDPADRFDSGAAVIEGLATLQSAAAGDLADRVSAVAPTRSQPQRPSKRSLVASATLAAVVAIVVAGVLVNRGGGPEENPGDDITQDATTASSAPKNPEDSGGAVLLSPTSGGPLKLTRRGR